MMIGDERPAGTGTFHWRSFLLLAVITTVVSAWFIAFERPLTDILFIVILTGLVLSDTFNSIYITLARKADAGWLGRLMLVHTGAFAVISIRRLGNIAISATTASVVPKPICKSRRVQSGRNPDRRRSRLHRSSLPEHASV